MENRGYNSKRSTKSDEKDGSPNNKTVVEKTINAGNKAVTVKVTVEVSVLDNSVYLPPPPQQHPQSIQSPAIFPFPAIKTVSPIPIPFGKIVEPPILYQWIKDSNGHYPKDAVQGGQAGEGAGEKLFVIRAYHARGGSRVVNTGVKMPTHLGRGFIPSDEGLSPTYKDVQTPGKLHPKYKRAYVCWGGVEFSVKEYEVLVAPANKVKWVASSHGALVANAIPGGITEQGEVTYIGRAKHMGTLVPGKIQLSHRVCYIPYGGWEFPYREYEILIHL